MPFCTTCGTAVEPDQKFCDHCGALQEPGDSIPADSIPPYSQPSLQTPASLPPPATPGVSKKTLMIIGIVAVLAVIACLYYSGLPLIQEGSHTTLPGGMSQTPSPVYQSIISAPTSTTSVYQSLTPDARYAGMYQTIYSKDRTFQFGAQEVFVHDLTHPPLYIKFKVTPKMVTRERLADIGTSNERMVSATYPDPDAWFEVKVIDANTGAVVESKGFNKGYSIMTDQEFMVRTIGSYRIEMAGNSVDSSVQVLTGIS
jgi:hypothetical protein